RAFVCEPRVGRLPFLRRVDVLERVRIGEVDELAIGLNQQLAWTELADRKVLRNRSACCGLPDRAQRLRRTIATAAIHRRDALGIARLDEPSQRGFGHERQVAGDDQPGGLGVRAQGGGNACKRAELVLLVDDLREASAYRIVALLGSNRDEG